MSGDMSSVGRVNNDVLTFKDSVSLIEQEHRRVIGVADLEAWDSVIGVLHHANRIFTVGNGRSGLALRMAAMRLMHLGFTVHVVGETTTPAIGSGDLLCAVSGSGTTDTVVRSAEIARAAGATVVAITATPHSPLAQKASTTLLIPAPEKHDSSGQVSAQYAGTLFEQTVLIFLDALFHTLWTRAGIPAEDLWPRHANMG